ncbi:hypothetical protein Neosp_003096 [[Neocosmospora] mangrovei]
MITNGEKYACESCIRGHRVAQCQHTDRPLQHVGKKGLHTKCKCGSTSRQITLKLFGEVPDVPVRADKHPGFVPHDLNSERPPPFSFLLGEPVHGEDPRTPPDNVTHLTTSQTPDWLGALDSVLGPMSNEPAKFLMPEFDDPLVSMDPSHLAQIWDDLPLPEQPENLDEVLAFDTDLPSIPLEHGDHLESFEYGS